MTPRLDELLHHCADLGLDVVYEDLSHLEHRGQWRWWKSEIALHFALTADQMVSVLAHELGHVRFGDTCSTPAAERRAWEYAGALLITPVEYAIAEDLVGSHVGALAKELAVTVKLIEGWRRWWHCRGQFIPGGRLRRIREIDHHPWTDPDSASTTRPVPASPGRRSPLQ